MAKVLQNFLIGVGLDTEKYDEGAKRVEGSLGRMRTLVGFTGSAISGAFALAGTAAINAGNRVDQFNLAVEGLNTSPEFINAYGRALAAMGGDAEDAVAAINAAENALAQLRLKGEFGSFQEAAFAGVDTHALMQAQTGEDFIRALAEVVPQMDRDQQRLIQDAWGLSDGVMRSLRGGAVELDAAIARAGELYGEFGRATEEAREFNRALAEINTRFERIGNTLAEKLLPGYTGLLNSFGDFLDANQEKFNKTVDFAAKSPTGSALFTGGALSGLAGAAAKGVGMKALGTTLSRLSPYGMIAGAGLTAWDTTPEDIENLTGYKPSSYIFEKTPMDAARDGWDYLSSRDWWSGSKGGVSVEMPEAPDYGLPLNQWNIHNPEPFDYGLPLNKDNVHAPVYAGGEVDNVEAANASPEVIMVKDQRQQANKPITPQRVSVRNNLEVRMDIDGRAIDSRVVKVIERRERDAAEDIYSSVDR